MKFVVVVGGVLSGLGKGIVSASLGLLLRESGFKVTAVKIDPYISIDAGTMRPSEHGEVFVTHDGGEIDQDLGHYERFLGVNLSRDNNITTGKVFQSVIDKERHFFYDGRDAEMIPDVINEIKEMVYKPSEGYDFSIVEVGGTTGDLENMPFLHAAREIGREHKTVYVMVTYLPFLRNVGELKTKPTQHAVARLREIGIVPDFIITRNEVPIDKPRIESIAKRCFVSPQNIIDDPDIEHVHALPIMFQKNKMAEKLLGAFGMKARSPNLTKWTLFVEGLVEPEREVNIALVGKYVRHGSGTHNDVYVSVLEAIKHACSQLRLKVNIAQVDSEILEDEDADKLGQRLSGFDGVVVPQGWGERGSEGKINAIKYARENKVAYLGLCFGMQMAIVEFGRNVVGLSEAHSEEIKPCSRSRVIHLMKAQKAYLKKKQYGGTIRLGAWPCALKKGSLLYSLYRKYSTKTSPWFIPREGVETKQKSFVVFERHRHRYEFNNAHKVHFEKAGMVFSGVSPDGKLVEAVELPDHPFFVGTQFHPEYLSRPLSPHPIFLGFVAASAKRPSTFQS